MSCPTALSFILASYEDAKLKSLDACSLAIQHGGNQFWPSRYLFNMYKMMVLNKHLVTLQLLLHIDIRVLDHHTGPG